jgi:transposase
MDLSKLHLHWGASQHKDNRYRSYSLARAYREDGKNRKEIVLKLGKLSEQEVKQWQDVLWVAKTPNAFFTTTDDIIVLKHLAYLDVMVVSEIWDEWQLDDVFHTNSNKYIQTETIARILTINRSIDPQSKSKNPNWCQNTVLPWVLNFESKSLTVSRVFRELINIEEYKEALCNHLFTLLYKKNPEAMSSVFYDLSSTTFTGSKCVLMAWGHCKEGYKNHIVLAIVVNRDGLPFYWEVLPGSTADSTTIVWLLERLQHRFKTIKTTVVFDRGMVSDNNLQLLEEAKIKYITAMDKNQIESITDMDFNTFSSLDISNIGACEQSLPGFIKLNEITYYRDIKVEDNRRYILCFNPQLFLDQRKAREQAIQDFKTFMERFNEELRESKRTRDKQSTLDKLTQQITRKKLDKFVIVKLTTSMLIRKDKAGYNYSIAIHQCKMKIDEKNKLNVGRLDGFWLLVTNHNEEMNGEFLISAPGAIQPYRDKVIIESAFRDIKSFVEISPVYLWTEEHVKAHFTICVLAYLINRTITLKLHKNLGEKTHGIITHKSFYQMIADCKVDHIHIKNKNISFYKMTSQNEEQEELLSRISLNHLLECKILKQMNQ